MGPANGALLGALLLTGAAVVGAQPPQIIVVGWEAAAWSPASPCPFPASDPVYSCTLPAVRLNVVGSLLGAAQGALQFGVSFPPSPQLPPPPADTPNALTLATLTAGSGGQDGCIATSLYTNDGNSYRFCPYTRVDLGDPTNNNAYVAHLGDFAGVTRTYIPENNCTAMTGQLFVDGDMCNGAPRVVRVDFTCIDTTAPEQDVFTQTPQIYSAVPSADGCSFALTMPILAACTGPNFGLCADDDPSPNPLPSPSPQFAYSTAFIATWAPTNIVAYTMGAAPPAAVRVASADGYLSAAFGALPEPLEPSRSPVPVPFPSTLVLMGLHPNSGPSTGGTTVTLMLSGVTNSDLAGNPMRFRVSWPRTDRSGSVMAALGVPGSRIAPQNGLLNVTVNSVAQEALNVATLTVASQFWVSGWANRRTAVCGDTVSGCGFSYDSPASLSPTSSNPPTLTRTPSNSPVPTQSHAAGVSNSITATDTGSASLSPTATASPVSATPSWTAAPASSSPTVSPTTIPQRAVPVPGGTSFSASEVAGVGVGAAVCGVVVATGFFFVFLRTRRGGAWGSGGAAMMVPGAAARGAPATQGGSASGGSSGVDSRAPWESAGSLASAGDLPSSPGYESLMFNRSLRAQHLNGGGAAPMGAVAVAAVRNPLAAAMPL